jgi:hypothetical protein
VYNVDNTTTSLTLRGWVLDPSASESTGVESLDVFLGTNVTSGIPFAQAQLGLSRSDVPSVFENPYGASAGFSINLPRDAVPVGLTILTLAAQTPEHGTWLTSLQVVIPSLGSVPPAPPTPLPAAPAPAPAPELRAEIQSPQAGDSVPHNFTVQIRAPGADRIDVFLEPDRDQGARLAGSGSMTHGQPTGGPMIAVVSAPPGAHTVYIHVSAANLPHEVLLTVPVTVRS